MKYTIDNHTHEFTEEVDGILFCKYCFLQKSTIESVQKQDNLPKPMKNQTTKTSVPWEKEFDEEFNGLYCYGGKWNSGCDDPEHCVQGSYVEDHIKGFISQTIKAEKLKLIEKIEKDAEKMTSGLWKYLDDLQKEIEV